MGNGQKELSYPGRAQVSIEIGRLSPNFIHAPDVIFVSIIAAWNRT